MTLKEFNRIYRSKINAKTVFIFDMDGTLVNTDTANRNAYFEAVQQVCHITPFPVTGRMTRESLKYSRLDEMQINQICEVKKNLYAQYLNQTILLPAADILQQYAHKYRTILATKADRRRAEETLSYHNLSECFTDAFYKDDFQSTTNKYQHIIETLDLDPTNIVVFENEDIEIQNAIKASICEAGIVPLLKSFIIFKSKPYQDNNALHLTKGNIQAYHHQDYKRGNYNFINVLKCDRCPSHDELMDAVQQLKEILYEDLPIIYQLLGGEEKEMTICAIPRSKARDHYDDFELQFNTTIGKVAQSLSETYSNIIDGTEYIIRHTDTPTTHLLHKDGQHIEVPVGITKSSCAISGEVAGKSILLIDDIYTVGVNIDEDAIQALYDNGAKNVTFYSIARTQKVKQ